MAPRALPRFVANTNPTATLSSSTDFPGSPVIRPTLLPPISRRDEEGFSSCATRPVSPCCHFHPAGVTDRLSQITVRHVVFAFRLQARPPEISHFRGHIRVRLHYGPVTRCHPEDGLVDGLQRLGFPPPCHPSYKALALTLAGLTPAERVRLRWTHNRTGGFPASGSPVGSCVSHTEHPGNRGQQVIGLAGAAQLPPCGARRFQWTAEPVDASTTPRLSSAVPSLGHVMLPGFPVFFRGNRHSHSRDPSPFGHRSSPEAPSLRRRYPASQVIWASPPPSLARPDPRGLSVGACHATSQGFPCCVHSPLSCVLPPLPRRNLSVHASLASRPVSAFPVFVAGRLPHCAFRGLLGVYSRCGPHGR